MNASATEVDDRLLGRSTYCPYSVSDLAARIEICNWSKVSSLVTDADAHSDGGGPVTIEVGGNARGKQSARGYSKRAAQVDHAGDGPAMKYLEAVLTGSMSINHGRNAEYVPVRTVWCCSIGSSKLTVPGLAAVTRSCSLVRQ